jgi:hypothetical protein
MSNHIEWGHATEALYTLHTRAAAEEEYGETVRAPLALGLFNINGDGLVLEGTRRELLSYLRLVTEHVERETDRRLELDQALRRLHTLRAERGAALDAGDHAAVTRLDEQEVSVLDDVAHVADLVNDEL